MAIHPVFLLLHLGFTFCQDSDLLGTKDGEKEKAKEEKIMALVSTLVLSGITRFILT